jgi:tetratricopeptide (TPR) repeat protein
VGRELGLAYTAHRALTELAVIAVLEGDLERADRLCREALMVAQETGYRVGMAMTQVAMGMAAHRRGDLLTARALHRQALGVFRELGVHYWIATALSALGFAEELLGNLDDAARCHQQASTVAQAATDQMAQAARSLLGEDRFQQAVARGRRLGAVEAVLTALR